MSASSRPTLAPLSPSAQARLIATVDLPTPPFPDATAIACLTPGMTWVGFGRLKAERTLAVIFRSTAVTPGRSLTSLCAMVWKRSRTGQAGVVSSKVNATRPSPSMTTSLIMPRLTTSRPRSGSWIAPSTARTSSVLGGALLSTEDHRRPHGQNRDQDQDRNDGRLHRHRGHGGGLAARLDASGLADAHHRCADPDQRDDPKGQPGHDPARRPGDRDGDEEGHEQNQLEDGEVSIRHTQPLEAGGGVGTVANEQRDGGRGSTQAGREKQAAQRPRVAPDRLVADAEQDAGVRGDEETEDRAHDSENAPDALTQNARRATAPIPDPGVKRRDRDEETENQQRPYPHRHR